MIKLPAYADFLAANTLRLEASLLDVLGRNEAKMRALPRNGRGEVDVAGMSLDIFPWHSSAQLSFRSTDESLDPATRYDVAAWELFNFISSSDGSSTMFDDTVKELGQTYGGAVDQQRSWLAHLCFLAAAEALLGQPVLAMLEQYGLDVDSRAFELIVEDSDRGIRCNYCELVRANRLTQRILAG
ncbi:MAG: hypothetical protein QM756_07795 [Polyangiaceae bacterium]